MRLRTIILPHFSNNIYLFHVILLAFASQIRHIPLSVTRSGNDTGVNCNLASTFSRWNEVDLPLVAPGASPPRVLRHKISARNISK